MLINKKKFLSYKSIVLLLKNNFKKKKFYKYLLLFLLKNNLLNVYKNKNFFLKAFVDEKKFEKKKILIIKKKNLFFRQLYNSIWLKKKIYFLIKFCNIIKFKKSYYNIITRQHLLIKKDTLLKYEYQKKNLTFLNAFYKKLLGLILKKGNKNMSLKLIRNTFELCKNVLKLPVYTILYKLYFKLKLSVESRKIKIRKSSHFVTVAVSKKRTSYLISNWLISAAKKNKIKKNLDYKLAAEIIKILKEKQSKPKDSKVYILKKSFEFRSNKHFRW